MTTPTQTFRRTTAAEQVAGELARAIREGELMPGTRLPTTRELGERFGVSLVTVGRALRELEKQDLAVCRRGSGAFVKQHVEAQRRPPGATDVAGKRVGLVGGAGLTDLNRAESWGGRILRGIEWRLLEAQHRLESLSWLPGESDSPAAVARQIDEAGDGLAGALLFADGGKRMIELLEARGLPWVTIGRPTASTTHNFAAPDALDGGRRVGMALRAAGMDRIVMLGRTDGQLTLDEATGLMQAYMDRAGAVTLVRTEGDYSEPAGYAAMAQHLGQHEPPQAIFALGDLYALGALRACRERNIRVPDDVVIVSDTGTALIEYADPPITTWQYPMEAVGREAAALLLEMIEQNTTRAPGRYVPGTIAFRESFMPAPQVQAMANRALQ